jgi:hypothetical protein
MLSGCSVSSLAARFAFFPPEPATYAVRKDEATGRLVASGVPRDNAMDVLLVDTRRGNKVVAFYLRNPCARLTVLYSHGNAADLGQLYDLFVQLKVNLKVNLMGLVVHCAYYSWTSLGPIFVAFDLICSFYQLQCSLYSFVCDSVMHILLIYCTTYYLSSRFLNFVVHHEMSLSLYSSKNSHCVLY